MPLADVTLFALAFLGHAALWIAVNNRIHAMPLPWRVVRLGGFIFYVGLLLLPPWFAWHYLGSAPRMTFADLWPLLGPVWKAYLLLCWATALGPLPLWAAQRMLVRLPRELRSNHSQYHNVARQLGRRPVAGLHPRRLLAGMPGNQIFDVEFNEKTVEIARLPAALDGLSILHLSDLHMAGTIGKEFYRRVMQLAGDAEADLVAVTGDLCDRRDCLDWFEDILGGLTARHGKFFILGNHDLRFGNPDAVRRAMTELGYVDLGRRWVQLRIEGTPVVLAGNELPWFLSAADMSDAPGGRGADRPLRVLLAHTPDQLAWARQRDFDLMLAGHTHGGQIRLPVLGPIVAPSYHGSRYASGTFSQPPTLMHVSRGIASLQTIRFNCRPEVTRLILRVPSHRRAVRYLPDQEPAALGGVI